MLMKELLDEEVIERIGSKKKVLLAPLINTIIKIIIYINYSINYNFYCSEITIKTHRYLICYKCFLFLLDNNKL